MKTPAFSSLHGYHSCLREKTSASSYRYNFFDTNGKMIADIHGFSVIECDNNSPATSKISFILNGQKGVCYPGKKYVELNGKKHHDTAVIEKLEATLDRMDFPEKNIFSLFTHFPISCFSNMEEVFKSHLLGTDNVF